MNYIKSHIRNLISNDEVDEAVTSLINLVVSRDFLNECLLLKSAIKKTSKKELLNVEYSDNLRVEVSQNLQSLLSLANEIPTDQEIVENRIRYAIDLEEDFSIANDIVNMCFSYELAAYSNNLNEKIENYQEIEIEYNENANIEEFLKLVDDCSISLLSKIESSSYYTGTRVNEFISTYLKNSSFIPRFVNAENENAESVKKVSPYFEDINNQVDKIRRHLLLWEERYLVGDYESALSRSEDARLGELSTKSINYEYTLITYVKFKNLDKIISNAIKTNKQGEFEYILLLINRSLMLDGKSSTLFESLRFVYNDFAQSIKKIYNNIDFSYLLNDMPRGRSKRRDYIKRLISLYVDFIEVLNVELEKSDSLPQEILKELDGVNKYPWIELKSGTLINRTNFNAIENRNRLIKAFERSEIYDSYKFYSSSSSKLNKVALKLKEEQANSESRKRGYLNAMMILDCLYGVERDDNLLEKDLIDNPALIGQNQVVKNHNSDGKDKEKANGNSLYDTVSNSSARSTIKPITPSEIVEFNQNNDKASPKSVSTETYNNSTDRPIAERVLVETGKKNNDQLLREKVILGLSAGILFLILLILYYI